MPQTTPAAARTRLAALLVLCAAQLMFVLDATIVTVAMPAIQADLGFSPSTLTWTLNAYLIPYAGLLLLSGRLGDLIGRRHMLVAGLAVFTAASVLCGLATSPQMLIAARFAQGVGGAMAFAVSLGLIVTLFTEPRERAQAIAAYAFVGAAGASIGLVLGGVLTEAINWHWIFLINAPFGITAAVLATRVIDADRGLGLREGADATGAVLVTSGLMLGVYTVVETTRYGWASAHTLGLGSLSIVLLAAFLLRQATATRPLLPLRLFRSRNVSGGNLIQALMVAAGLSFQVHTTLYMQRVLGYGPAETGLALTTTAIVIGTLSLGFSARLNARFGERRILIVGLTLLTATFALLTRLPVDGHFATDLLPSLLLGGGFGLALPAVTTFGMSDATAEDSGLASGLFNTTFQLGGALGVAVLSTLAAGRTEHLLADGQSTASALTGGYHMAFGTGTGLVAAAIVLAVAILRPKAAAQPEPATAGPPKTADAMGADVT